MARTAGSRSAATSSLERVSSIGPEIVFMRSGAFSVMVATWSATSTRTSSLILAPYAALFPPRESFVTIGARAGTNPCSGPGEHLTSRHSRTPDDVVRDRGRTHIMQKTRLAKAGAVLLGLTLVGAACGSDNSS